VAPTVDGFDDLAKDFTALRPARPLQPALATAANGGFPKALAIRHRVEPLYPRIEADSFMGPWWTAPYMPNPQIPPEAEQRRAVWYPAMAEAACDAGVPTSLFDALIIQESRYNPVAVSPKGATGLAQLMPASARVLGVRNIWDPRENMRGGARYLRSLLDEFGRFDLALAAYNAGAGRVRTRRQVPRIAETIHYVSGILTTMQRQLALTMVSRE
jgi:soluble lytic murein transglycosylase-like protein